MKILLINSDLAKNRGDRAIAEGLIQLIRLRYPNADITGLSENAPRDRKWFGINFLNSDVYTLNPFKWIELILEARRSDIVYWGGGEYLKDYTNKAALWYWAVKILLLRMVNKNIYGTFQGIGPTQARHSQWLVRKIVEMTKVFAVRDGESYQKLIDWGVDEKKLLCVADPAVFPEPRLEPRDLDAAEGRALDEKTKAFGKFVAIAPRNWFHYTKGKILPHRIRKIFGETGVQTEDNKTYIASLVRVIESAAQKYETVVLVPMHMSEDVDFCHMLSERCSVGNVQILEEDSFDPEAIRYFLARAELMIGFRLHSNIIATSGYTPCLNYYYVDKGRAYFDQIEQSDFCFPIESLLEEGFMETFEERVSSLRASAGEVSGQLETKTKEIRKRLSDSIASL